MNGLDGREILEPTKAPPGWSKAGLFAKIDGEGQIHFPTVPVSWYVFETELEIHTIGSIVAIWLGGPERVIEMPLGPIWPKEADMGKKTTPCRFFNGRPGFVWTSDAREFWVGDRLKFKVVVGDRGACLFQGDEIIHRQGSWPADLGLRINAEANSSATIHACSFRAIEEKDLAKLPEWARPGTPPTVDPEKARKRIEADVASLPITPAQPRFAPPTTGMPLVWIEPGEFDMGTRDSDPGRKEYKHRVRITKGFWMGQYEVTQREWLKVMGNNPSRVKSDYLPVDWVSYDDAMRFCALLTKSEWTDGRLPKGYVYRLPTEAEWEYACRAGSDADHSATEFWHSDNSMEQMHEVGQKLANAWGLYDMHGNVWEMTLDRWYDYPKSGGPIEIDPVYLAPEGHVIVRGGSWLRNKDECRSWNREVQWAHGGGYTGFRIVLGPVITDPAPKMPDKDAKGPKTFDDVDTALIHAALTDIGLGQRLLKHTHPTGMFTSSLPLKLSRSPDRTTLSGDVTIQWKGVSDTPYETVFRIEITQAGLRLTTVSDNALFQINPKNLQQAEADLNNVIRASK
jgi:formylglycine-generating enzyme required for sulfatase activity